MRTSRPWLAAALAVLAAAPAGAAPASASASSASSATWGTPAARAPTAAQGAEDDAGGATGDYFHDFGELIVRVRSVGWLADICAEAFPAGAALDHQAYADWLRAHRAFVDEMEGQFALIDKRWSPAAPAGADGAAGPWSVTALKARLEASRAGLKADFLARARVVQQRRCDAYPQLLLGRAFDLEHSQAELVRSVRLGPPP